MSMLIQDQNECRHEMITIGSLSSKTACLEQRKCIKCDKHDIVGFRISNLKKDSVNEKAFIS
jgi:uncharacterized protein (UPF0548 family)